MRLLKYLKRVVKKKRDGDKARKAGSLENQVAEQALTLTQVLNTKLKTQNTNNLSTSSTSVHRASITTSKTQEGSSSATSSSSIVLNEVDPIPEPPTSPSPTTDSPSASSLPEFFTSKASVKMPGPTESDLRSLVNHLHTVLSNPSSTDPEQIRTLLSRGKLALLHLDVLLPKADTSPSLLSLARETLEVGALLSIHIRDLPDGFIRYFQQLQPFYVLDPSRFGSAHSSGNRSKITGLYLLLLLSQQDYLGFHMVLESLELLAAAGGSKMVEDEYIRYPVRLERALMEGSYDRVWGEITGERVPGEEFGVFSEVLIGTIRSEIASCSEKAYPSVPVANAKNLFFLESEGAVLQFAKERGWNVKDGRIWFPAWAESDVGMAEKDVLSVSGTVIENTLGYARELETIV